VKNAKSTLWHSPSGLLERKIQGTGPWDKRHTKQTKRRYPFSLSQTLDETRQANMSNYGAIHSEDPEALISDRSDESPGRKRSSSIIDIAAVFQFEGTGAFHGISMIGLTDPCNF
jgi:hypothetical protein